VTVLRATAAARAAHREQDQAPGPSVDGPGEGVHFGGVKYTRQASVHRHGIVPVAP
jgi:hypothetical protein